MKAAMVVLYEPEIKDIENIKQYCDNVDLMIILDNSIDNNFKVVNSVTNIDNEKTIYKHFSKNIGLCAALNIGMEIADTKGCEWALIMDDDSSLITNILEIYIKYISENDTTNVAVLSPVHIYDRSKAQGYPGYKKINWAMTSGCYFNIKIFKELDGFFEALFVECLDLDYCYKALEKGYVTIQCGEAQLRHYPAETRTIKILGRKIISYGVAAPWRYYMQARSLTWLFLRYQHLGDLKRFFWKSLKVLFFFERKKEYLRQMLIGTREGIDLWKDYRKSLKT